MATRRTAKATPETEATTTLDADVTVPSVTAPGDGPADTTDPTEIAVSVPFAPSEEAIKAGTVNAVIPVEPEDLPTAPADEDTRYEKYDAVRPDGTKVTVKRNLETGESEVISEKSEA